MSALQNLSFSIFYKKSYWHVLINEAICQVLENEEILNSCLMLSQKRGDHLRLVLTAHTDKAYFLAAKTHEHLKDFLVAKPSKLTKGSMPEKGIFKNFENNSLHHGVFDLVLEFSNIEIYQMYLQGVSSVLIEIFKHYEQDTLDALPEIMIELLTIFCDQVGFTNKESHNFLDLMLEAEYKNYEKQDLPEIMKINRLNFEENGPYLIEYLNTYKSQKIKFADETWQSIWQQTILNCTGRLSKKNGAKTKEKEYPRMINYLITMFDFNDKVSIYYLLSNAWKVL